MFIPMCHAYWQESGDIRSAAARVDFKSLSICVDETNAYFRIETVDTIPSREAVLPKDTV